MKAQKIADLFEMANLFLASTGLPVTIWVSSEGSHGRQLPQGPEIKVGSSPESIDIGVSVSVSIALKPIVQDGRLPKVVYNAVKKFIQENMECLLDYWYGRIETKQLIERIKKV